MRTSPNRLAVRFGLLALLAASGVHAESVYKCAGADGSVAFQDRPCAAAQKESQVEILPAPPAAPSPEYGVASRSERAPRATRSGAKPRAEVVSYECRAANGELFYRHGACPKQITAKAHTSGTSSKRRGGADTQSFAVAAEPLSRGEVCRRMAKAGSIGRTGHERDDSVSTYDRNLGRDPCRRF